MFNLRLILFQGVLSIVRTLDKSFSVSPLYYPMFCLIDLKLQPKQASKLTLEIWRNFALDYTTAF